MNYWRKGKAEHRRVGRINVCWCTYIAKETQNEKAGGDGDPSTAKVSVQDPLFPVGLCPEESANPGWDLQGVTQWKDGGGWDSGLEQSAEMKGNEEVPLHRTPYHHLYRQ